MKRKQKIAFFKQNGKIVRQPKLKKITTFEISRQKFVLISCKDHGNLRCNFKMATES